MNYVAAAIAEHYSGNDKSKDILQHIGVKFRSGRYPYGSGDNPYQHEKRHKLRRNDVIPGDEGTDFLDRVLNLREKKDFTWTDDDGIWGQGKGKVFTGDTAIAHYMGLSTGQFRAAVTIAEEEVRSKERSYTLQRRNEGASLMTIAKELGYKNDSSVRALLDEDVARRKSVTKETAAMIKKMVDEHGMIEIGEGTALNLDISKVKFDQAIEFLQLDGYEKYPRRFPQKTNPGKMTTFTILCKPGTEYKEVYSKDLTPDDIYFPASEYVSHDDGVTFDKRYQYPSSMDSKRLMINYSTLNEDGTLSGGVAKDGVIELRRGVKDLDLGGSHYAQVRILVDGTHYLKGMAVYADDLPDGIDIRFNTNKTADVPALGSKDNSVLKPIKRNKDGTPKDDPFGSLIKAGVNDPDDPTRTTGGQSYYYDDDGKKKLSLINKRADEGDWDDWADKLPAQFLSKQNIPLINRQLKISEDLKKSEYDSIMDLDNPTVKKVMLEKFADSCDKGAETLKAASLPRQHYKVILPLTTLKDDEIYAPGYKDGEKVCLVRFPHGGTFEIPYLTVNNRNKEGKSVITKDAMDAVGITKKVADQLSGADFDGDTVLVLPTGSNGINIAHRPALKELKDFDTKLEYGGKPEGTYKRMTKDQTQNEMGKVSNLITDMTILGAEDEDLAKAVKHSMVIIDAEKHGLDYQQSAIDNDYMALKRKWQLHTTSEGKESTGVSTLISRANAKIDIPKTRGSGWTDPVTGEKKYAKSGETYVESKPNKKDGTISIINERYDKETKSTYYEEMIVKQDTKEVLYKGTPTRDFKIVPRTQKATRMSQVSDAYDLMSEYEHPKEKAYADYANYLKNMANTARLEVLNTPGLKYNKEAALAYEDEVNSLKSKLKVSKMNKPLERQAQFIADTMEQEALKNDEDLRKDSKELKKFRQQWITKARADVGAKRTPITFTDREWEAIQNGAIHDTTLREIMNFVDDEELKQRATPHDKGTLSTADISRIKNLAANGYEQQQIAEMFGVSTSTVAKYSK